jgi:TPR repeat protein
MKSRIVSPFHAVLLACAMGLTAVSAQADGGFERGAAAHRHGDYQAAVKLWQPLAEKGQVDAQYNLGVMYYSGDGVKQDYVEAAKWLRMAAEQGDEQAQYYMGSMYLNGEGVKQSESEADKWFTMKRRDHRHNHAQM